MDKEDVRLLARVSMRHEDELSQHRAETYLVTRDELRLCLCLCLCGSRSGGASSLLANSGQAYPSRRQECVLDFQKPVKSRDCWCPSSTPIDSSRFGRFRVLALVFATLPHISSLRSMSFMNPTAYIRKMAQRWSFQRFHGQVGG